MASKQINPLVSGLAGAAIGAGATAAAFALSDKKTRDKLGIRINELREAGMKKVKVASKGGLNLKKAEEKFIEAKKKIKNKK